MAVGSQPAVGGAALGTASGFSRPLALVLAVVLLAGALFGYDQGVISGALRGVQKEFRLTALLTEVVTSWVTLGALAGSLFGGELADRLGRRKTILIAAVLFALGAAIEALAPDVGVLVAGRFVVGFGVGVASVSAPLYGAEMAPSHLRGRFVSAYQLAITIGIFLSYRVDEALAGAGQWRLMLGASAVPAVLLLLAMLPAGESPRWLAKVGRRDEARDELARLRPGVDPTAALQSMEEALRQDTGTAALNDLRAAHSGIRPWDGPAGSWGEVLRPRWRKPLLVGLGLAVFQQITGINAIIYYSDSIFAAAGFATPVAQAQATLWAVGGVNVVATFIAVAYIDRLGRRPLLLAGLAGMGASLLAVGLAFRDMGHAHAAGGGVAGTVTLVALIVFIASFAFSLGPVVWTVINEIFPGRVRGRAVAVATAVNWGAAWLVSEFFLSLVNGIGEAQTFLLFAFFCLVGGIWVYRRVPETRGRSLEEIEAMWRGSGGAVAAPRGPR